MASSKKSERVIVRLSPEEKQKLVAHAERKGQTESWVMREYIRRLPAVPKPKALPPAREPLQMPLTETRESDFEPVVRDEDFPDFIELEQGTPPEIIQQYQICGIEVRMVPKKRKRRRRKG